MKIKNLCFLMVLVLVISGFTLSCRRESSQALPDINSLPELKVELVLNLSDYPDIGLPATGRISPQGEFVFFDSRLNQIIVMSLDGQSKRSIGSYGQGPGEYQYVYDILADDNSLVILDNRSHLIEYDWEGHLQRETKLPVGCSKILGRSGDIYYLSGIKASETEFFEHTVIKWSEETGASTLFTMKSDVMRTAAYGDDGKELSGGGLLIVQYPAFAFLGTELAAATGSRYLIHFYDLAGKEIRSWEVKAPRPEFSGSLAKFFNKAGKEAYAVRNIFVWPDKLAVLGNFFRNGQPRLDCFDLQGKLTSSWLMPSTGQQESSSILIDLGYLIYFSEAEGCRIYRILSSL